ncbi:MAG: hypothetical protein M0032_09800 [Actinomycetota bacterium]|nr:hypothetical protein [Actinomycetota bacterium]
MTSHANVELAASPIDPERTQIRVRGRLRPPLAPALASRGDEVTERLARVVVRSLLRRVSRVIEEAAIQSATMPPPCRPSVVGEASSFAAPTS